MKINEEALTEFIDLYKKEFNEDISRDDAEIMARNLVMFYECLHDKGVFQAADEKENAAPASESASIE